MLFKSLASVAVVATALSQGVSAQFNSAFKNMTAVYWGQNAAYAINQTYPFQTDLFTTCNNTNIDIVIISFVTKFAGKAGLPILNLSNQCGNFFPYAENPKNMTDILNCPDIGTKITQCQALGKKVFLSLGGATYTNPGWPSVQAARDSANTIWAMFGPPGSAPYKYRPFGNAIIDGYDLDFEFAANKPNVDAFAALLKAKFSLMKSRNFYLTAAPQCPNPDAALDLALTKVPFDAIFIQFYNNNCQSTTWVKGKAQTTNQSFNLKMWQTWATTKSNNTNIKLFIGFLGGGIPGTTGYVSKAVAQAIVAESKSSLNFGGASFWDASVLNINTGILPAVRGVLNGTVVIKRDVESAEVEERQLKSPVGGAATFSADDFVEVKVPAEAVRKFRRRHSHQHGARYLP